MHETSKEGFTNLSSHCHVTSDSNVQWKSWCKVTIKQTFASDIDHTMMKISKIVLNAIYDYYRHICVSPSIWLCHTTLPLGYTKTDFWSAVTLTSIWINYPTIDSQSLVPWLTATVSCNSHYYTREWKFHLCFWFFSHKISQKMSFACYKHQDTLILIMMPQYNKEVFCAAWQFPTVSYIFHY